MPNGAINAFRKLVYHWRGTEFFGSLSSKADAVIYTCEADAEERRSLPGSDAENFVNTVW